MKTVHTTIRELGKLWRLGRERLVIQVIEANASAGNTTGRAIDGIVIAERANVSELWPIVDWQLLLVAYQRAIGVAVVDTRSLWALLELWHLWQVVHHWNGWDQRCVMTCIASRDCVFLINILSWVCLNVDLLNGHNCHI